MAKPDAVHYSKIYAPSAKGEVSHVSAPVCRKQGAGLIDLLSTDDESKVTCQFCRKILNGTTDLLLVQSIGEIQRAFNR